RTEKEKMISGDHYHPFNPQLVQEREDCKIALSRFNNALTMGVSRQERSRLFRLILEPPHLKQQLPPIQPAGSLGEDVQVEAPFTCDYGYNIMIGDEVVIGANCTIIDPVRVSIGPRCVIGPNVCIYAGTVSTNPKVRKGSKGTAIGKPIHIEEDVYIGGSAIILPGVRIRKGSTIAAGSVV
ncbi:trimeric LpxA-like protein, partial [Saccharata proteae CBS 121410]